jgi:pre-rRNA-processing protein TSR4
MEEEGEELFARDDEDDSTTSESEEESQPVFLGFLEDEEDEVGEENPSSFVDSFVGGKPVWLKRPQEKPLVCSVCGDVLVLLAQIYAPLDTVETTAYHRVLYVFICTKGACWKKKNCVAVLRSQLAKEEDRQGDFATCCVCGKPGSKACSQCHRRKFCSKSHQLIDWRAGHKQKCKKKEGQDESPDTEEDLPEDESYRYKKRYLDTEEEQWIPDKAAFRELADAHSALVVNDHQIKAKILPSAASETNVDQSKSSDRFFLRFQNRCQAHPDQVLRYAWGAKAPLWVNAEGQMVGSPPVCEACGAERVFELQLMPQLLFYMNVDKQQDNTAMDWSSIVVYSCSKSCKTDSSVAEFPFIH